MLVRWRGIGFSPWICPQFSDSAPVVWILDQFAKSCRGWILLIPCFADLVDNSSVIRREGLPYCVTKSLRQMSEISLKDLQMTCVL